MGRARPVADLHARTAISPETDPLEALFAINTTRAVSGSQAARSVVVRFDVVRKVRPGLALSCMEQPTQQKRASDYRNGEHLM